MAPNYSPRPFSGCVDLLGLTKGRVSITLTVEGVRLEVPSRFRHLDRLTVRYATWDLSRTWLWDAARGVVLAPLYPLDKAKNPFGARRASSSAQPISWDQSSKEAGPYIFLLSRNC